mgnify:FL=1
MKNISYYNNSVVNGYYDIIFEKKKGVQSAWHHIKFNYIKSKITKTNLHLDIGCGPGTFLGILKKKSIGIDVAQNQIKYAKEKYANKKIKFLTYKNKLPIKSNSIESISMIELIEHIDNKDLKYLLKECRRVLKKDGKIYLSTPNYLSLWPLLEFFLNIISPVNYKHEHINKFNKKRLKKIMVKSGFQIIELRSFILLSPFLAFFTFNFAKSMTFLDNFLTKFFPGFLLFCKLKKS